MKVESRRPGVFCHRYYDERVVAFILQNSDRASVDVYADWIVETLKAWPAEKPLLIVYDIADAVFTTYARRRSLEVYDAVPTEGITGRTAIVFSNTRLGQFMKIFANKAMRVQNPRMDRKFFTKLDEAVQWVNEFKEVMIKEAVQHS